MNRMMAITYLNFDLTVEQTEDGYFVRVLAAPAGEAVAPFQPTFTGRELAALHQSLAPREGQVRREARDDSAIRTAGERLFLALFSEHIRLTWDESLRLAYQQRSRLRLRLHVHALPEFTDLPWEYLYDPRQQEFLALSTQTPVVRFVDLRQPIVPLKVAQPLRMLVVIANPGGQPLYDEDAVWIALVDTLDHLAVDGKLILERLMRPTVHELQRRLRHNHYHILHIIGHGDYDPLAQEHLLLFEDEMGRTRPVNSQHLGSLARDHFPLRLVTLQACPTARFVVHNPYTGVARQLLRRGLPAAVALQQPLSPPALLYFADKFYQAIADYTPVDSALTEARRALWLNNGDPAWGRLSLDMRNPDGVLFVQPPAQNSPPPRKIFTGHGA